MTGKKLQRLLACLLAVLLLSQVGAFSPAVFAADDIDYTLQDGTAIIKSTMTTDEVNHALTRALVKDFDQKSEDTQAKLLDDLKWEYECEGKSESGVIKNTAWGTVDGFTTTKRVLWTDYTCTHPALKDNSDGTYQVRVAGTKTVVTLTKAKKRSSSITLKEGVSVKLPYKEDGTLDFDALRENIFSLVVKSTTPEELTVKDVTIKYFASLTTGSLTDMDKRWVSLEGETISIPGKELGYPAISAGEQKIRISYKGSDDYKAVTEETTVNFLDRDAAPFQLKQGVTEVSMVYNKDQSINYEETAQALREALLVSADSNVSINDVTVQYNAGTDAFKNYQPLNYSPTGSDILDNLFKFGLGSQTIHFVWNGNANYKPLKLDDVKVEMIDNRIKSNIVLKKGVSLIYNKDAAVMEQNIFEYVIDWDDSTLPDKSTLSVDDFTFSYYAEPESGSAGDLGKDWAPIGGGKILLLTYPQMGAGEQQIRVTFNGSETYCRSEAVEGPLTVKKAPVSVKVHSTSIYADEAPGKDFVTTDPADKFDIFTIYTGVSSVFVQLPERFTDNAFITVVDKALERVGLRTIKDIMDKGITVGELKQNLDKIVNGDQYAAVREALKLMGVDVTTLQQIINVFNKITLLDNVRIALRTPDQVGIYTVYAITNNDNYNTGFGMGALVVKKHYSGVKLTWNQNFTNGKISAADVANFNFGATLSYNGNSDISQDNVHYLYSGFTSKWKPYSSTTTPPTEPGRYVVTVVTLGGNYQAAPITRAFQITK